MNEHDSDLMAESRRAVRHGLRHAFDVEIVARLVDEVERLRAEVERLAPRAARVDDVMRDFAECEGELWRLRVDSVELARLREIIAKIPPLAEVTPEVPPLISHHLVRHEGNVMIRSNNVWSTPRMVDWAKDNPRQMKSEVQSCRDYEAIRAVARDALVALGVKVRAGDPS